MSFRRLGGRQPSIGANYERTSASPSAYRYDAFVTKFNSSGSAVLYSTRFATFLNDFGSAIAVDAEGNAYVTGSFDNASKLTDVFVVKVNAAGSSHLYTTFLSGSNADAGLDIAVDGAGNAYVTGYTLSSDFPTVNALQGAMAGRRNPWMPL